MHEPWYEKSRGRRMTFCLLALVALLVMSMSTSPPLRGQDEQGDIVTGPIDPAAGAWITYRGERTIPDQPGPQAFSVRLEYTFPSEGPQDGKAMGATLTESNAAGQAVSIRSFLVQTIDRFYLSQDGTEKGYWTYWFMPGLGEEDTASVGTGTKLTVDEVQDYDFKGNRFQVARMRGEGIEVMVEQRTGLVFRIARDGGETLQIEDTNMLAQYSSWEYCLDDSTVGRRLDSLASDHPELVEVSSLGKSAKGRDIWAAHVTDFTSNDSKSAVVMDAATEGDAPEGSAFLLDFLEELVQRAGEDEEAARLLSRLNIYAVPLVNPDGMQRWLAMPAPGDNPMLSSQAPRNGNLVNINRNFDLYWHEGDHDPVSAEYAGPAPFSETESQVLGKLFEDIPVDLYLSLHTGNDLINAPWNRSDDPASNPELPFYESVLAEISGVFPFQVSVGNPISTFSGSSTDWAYEGNGASSPMCFDLYMHRPTEGEVTEEDGWLLEAYAPHRKVISLLMENVQSYLAVDIIAPEIRVEVNVPIDATVEIVVGGKRALPNAKVRLILPEDSGLKFSSLSEKEIELGDLEPGTRVDVTWNLEGKTSESDTATVILTSSFPEYDHIPGTYSAGIEISISTQRTMLVLVLLSILILLVLGTIFLSMRKHARSTGQKP